MTLPPLPCPFCGSTNIRTDDARDFLACMDCHTEGPCNIGMGSNYAVEAWNRRAAIAAHVPEAECGNIAAVPAQPPAPTAQQCTCPSGDGSLRWPCPQHPANIAQPVQQPGAELVGWQYRWTNPAGGHVADTDDMAWKEVKVSNIHMQTMEQRIAELRAYRYRDRPTYEVRAIYTQTAPAQRQPLSDDTKTQMWRAAYRDDPRRLGSFEWYAQGVEDAEAAHGITAAPAAQKGEKL